MSGFPQNPIIDSFTRPDENPLAGGWAAWTGLAPMELVSNAIRRTGSTFAGAYWNANEWGDQEIYIRIATNDSTQFISLKARMRDTVSPGGAISDSNNTGYTFSRDFAGNVTLVKVTGGGGSTTLASTTATFANGDWIGMECIGGRIRGMYKAAASPTFSELLSAYDTQFPIGRVGLVVEGPTYVLDDFGGGELPAQPPVSRPSLPVVYLRKNK